MPARGYLHGMARLGRRDAAPAVVLVLVGQIDVWAPDLVGASVVEPRWAVSVTYLVMASVLVARRVKPLATFLVVMAAMTLQVVTVGTTEGNGVLLPGLVAAYSLAAHAPRRRAVAGLAVLPVAIVLRELNNPQNTNVEDVVNALGWDLTVVAAWLLGAYLRTRRQLVRELADRAARAEREREERAAAAVAEERARIAREMHDVVAHSISVIVVQAEAAEEMLVRDPPAAARPLRAIQRTGRDTLTEMRRLLEVLHEEPGGAVNATVPDLVDAVRETGLCVRLDDDGVAQQLPPAAGRAVYRIAQESLTNVLKHAQATEAVVRLRRDGGGIAVEVCDDGVGGPAGSTGRGLAGMRERVSIHGGRFHAGPSAERGFTVRAWLPIPEQP